MAVVAATGSFALSLAVVVGLIYLLVVRLVDLNEREPMWGVGAALLLGALAGGLLPLVVSSKTLTLAVFRGALADELAKFVALAAVVALFEGISRVRGWSELNGLMDGLIYGTAVGLGFAVGEAFYRSLLFASLDARAHISRFDVLWTTLLYGLRHGLFGAIIGVGFGLAVQARTAPMRWALPFAGAAAAFIVHALYILLGGATGGTGGQIRTWLVLILPAVFVLLLAAYALLREKRTIAAELAPEVATGVASEEDVRLIENPAARRALYFRLLRQGDLDGWAHMRALHNRLIQLALVKRRLTGQEYPDARAAAEVEVENLRAAAVGLRAALDARGRPPEAEPAR